MDPEIAHVVGLMSGSALLLEHVREALEALGENDAATATGTVLHRLEELRAAVIRLGRKEAEE